MCLNSITVSTNPLYNVCNCAVMSVMEILQYSFMFIYFNVSLHPVKLTSPPFIEHCIAKMDHYYVFSCLFG